MNIGQIAHPQWFTGAKPSVAVTAPEATLPGHRGSLDSTPGGVLAVRGL